jgi:hypothetical protein
MHIEELCLEECGEKWVFAFIGIVKFYSFEYLLIHVLFIDIILGEALLYCLYFSFGW